jgi:hypothetical protein
MSIMVQLTIVYLLDKVHSFHSQYIIIFFYNIYPARKLK